jgi:tetratricopeptide (TPR) repeat protein
MNRRLFCAVLLMTVILAGCASAPGKKAGAAKPIRQPLTSEQRERLLAAVQSIGRLTDEGHDGAVRAGYKELAADLPQIARFDLKVFGDAEVHLAKKHYDHAAKSYKKMVDDYPESELRGPALARLYQIGTYYLTGPVVLNLVIFKVRGYERGIKILDDVSEEVGLQDPNGLGVKAAVAVARIYEKQKKYEDAYLKWSEIAAVWDKGPLGKESLLAMAQDKLSVFNAHKPKRRHLYDGSPLTASRGYYQKFQERYPEDANQMDVKGIVAQIDRDMAYKQLSIAEYYRRIHKTQAADLYLDMVIRTWPRTPAAQTAREILASQGAAVH